MQRCPLARYIPPLLLVASCADGGESEIVLHPELIDFGAVVIGEEVAEEVQVCNEGNDELHIQNIEPYPAVALAITGVQSVLVQPGGCTSFEVVFIPEAEGVLDAEVLVDSDDPDEPVGRVQVSGEGVTPP